MSCWYLNDENKTISIPELKKVLNNMNLSSQTSEELLEKVEPYTKITKEVIHAKWTEERYSEDIFDYSFRCSNCNGLTPRKSYTISPDICPHCGAHMDLVEEDN